MRFASLADWLDWQAGLHPKQIQLGLERVRGVWRALGDPPLDAPVITIAGTNGKGSCVAFADAILRAAGYRCGCYTSPHLLHYNERIRIDGEAADDARICAAFDRIDRARGDIPLTYFEFGTLAALLLFADAGLDAVVLEVGLGGRLDAVNLIDADVALITNIALDHEDWLGSDLESIGREKAGIMRAARPVVFGAADMPASIAEHAAAIGAELLRAGRDYRVQRASGQWQLVGTGVEHRALPEPGMHGRVQIDNAAGVLVALGQLAARLPIDAAAVRAGLRDARVAGRFDVRPGRPTWVLDVAHNPAAATVLDGQLDELAVAGDRIALCGMLADKDARGIASALRGRFDRWLTIDLSAQPRGRDATELAATLRDVLGDQRVDVGGSPPEVFATAAAAAGDDDQLVVFGSFVTVGAAMSWLERR